jgi:hypothetical protein
MPTNKTRGEAVSKAQQRLMGAAEHGATFPLARQIRQAMTYAQMHNFAIGSEKGKPEHVRPKKRRKTDPRD